MDKELLQKIERLEAQVEALTSERIPTVDRASKRRDKRQVFAGFGLFAVAVMIAGTMSASALSGSNTVDSGDIKDGTITSPDIASSAILGSRVRDDTLTGADIKESTLVLPSAGSSVIGQIRSTGSTTVAGSPTDPPTPVNVPVSGGTFTQPVGKSLAVAAEVTVNVPTGINQAGCGGLIFPAIQAWVMEGSTTVGTILKIVPPGDPLPATLTIKIPSDWTIEGDASTTHTYTVKVSLNQCAASKSVTVTKAKVNVFGL